MREVWGGVDQGVRVTGCFWFIINWLSKMIEGRFSPGDDRAARGTDSNSREGARVRGTGGERRTGEQQEGGTKGSGGSQSGSSSTTHSSGEEGGATIQVYGVRLEVRGETVGEVQGELSRAEREARVGPEVWLSLRVVLLSQLAARRRGLDELLLKYIAEYSHWRAAQLYSAVC